MRSSASCSKTCSAPNSTRSEPSARRSRCAAAAPGSVRATALFGPGRWRVLAKTVRRLLPADTDGGILNGNLTVITAAVGRDSFNDGNYNPGPFLASDVVRRTLLGGGRRRRA